MAGDFKTKFQLILTDIGGKCYEKTFRNPALPENDPCLSKKHQEEDNFIKVKLRVE